MALVGWGKARKTLALAALLDSAGLIGLFVGLATLRGALPALGSQTPLVVVLTMSYCSLGWLFGSYTLLKVKRLRWYQFTLRLGATGIGGMLVAALLEWSWRASPEATLLHRGSVLPSFALAALLSGANRLALRQLERDHSSARWTILAKVHEQAGIAQEWQRTGQTTTPPRFSGLPPKEEKDHQIISQLSGCDGLAISVSITEDIQLQQLCEQLVRGGLPVTTLIELAEQELQRIPPSWIGRQWLLFSQRIDGARSTPDQQLKRFADVALSLGLITVSSPLWLLTAAAIRLQDNGPIFYRQVRTGFLGERFEIVKFRTMITNAETDKPKWAQVDDRRVTPAGKWLRRTRIDELPQLLNVLRGEMSLIGPRPERPELEEILEEKIPNYRLRHWIRPGLSGWAQVNMPYSASVEDSELKVSYDLFYLRNANLWLDILILLKTIKIVLKAAGR